MMLNMEIHMPVEETYEGVQDNRAGAEAKICHVVLQPGVLRTIAQITQPAAVEHTTGGHDRQQP